MTTRLIDLRQVRDLPADDLQGLRASLAQLIGEPFRFARVSYGDELTLHFGDLRPAKSPKLGKHFYGAFVLGVRGSPWILKSGFEPLMLAAGIDLDNVPAGLGRPVDKIELESSRLIQPASRALSASPFVVKPVNGLGLQLRLSDGSTLYILPEVPEVEEPGDAALPGLADWELASPNGLLRAGPGLTWSFKPLPGSDSHPKM